jgi:hypothetical protein
MKRILLALALTIPVMGSVSPADALKGYPCEKYHKLMRQHGLPVKQFAPIMWRESRCIPQAVNWNMKAGKTHADCTDNGSFHKRRQCQHVRSWDMGLLQINSATWDDLTVQQCGATVKSRTLLTPSCNVKVAGVIYRHYGMTPWKGNSNG